MTPKMPSSNPIAPRNSKRGGLRLRRPGVGSLGPKGSNSPWRTCTRMWSPVTGWRDDRETGKTGTISIAGFRLVKIMVGHCNLSNLVAFLSKSFLTVTSPRDYEWLWSDYSFVTQYYRYPTSLVVLVKIELHQSSDDVVHLLSHRSHNGEILSFQSFLEIFLESRCYLLICTLELLQSHIK